MAPDGECLWLHVEIIRDIPRMIHDTEYYHGAFAARTRYDLIGIFDSLKEAKDIVEATYALTRI